jgi:hypothetical protein
MIAASSHEIARYISDGTVARMVMPVITMFNLEDSAAVALLQLQADIARPPNAHKIGEFFEIFSC